MNLMRHERNALGFLLRHLVMGVTGAVVFGGLVLYFDIGHLRSLSLESGDGFLALALFFFGLMASFGAVAMGIGVMSQAHDEN